jgi:hypothetical protein
LFVYKLDFPNGELILEVLPQIVIAPHAYDYKSQPITLETYAFDPTEVLETITLEQYLEFLIYSLEFRTLMLEQIADAREKQYILENKDHLQDGYGILLKLCCIRDLRGVGFRHLGSKTKQILKVALDIALPFYPEYLGKSHMVSYILILILYILSGTSGSHGPLKTHTHTHSTVCYHIAQYIYFE